jgi:hypothetical protein
LHALLCQTPFYQTAPLLLYVGQQQNLNYWQEFSTSTAIPPAFASNVMDQKSKIGGITFTAPPPWYNSQNYWVLGLCPLSGFQKIREQNISETGYVSVLR